MGHGERQKGEEKSEDRKKEKEKREREKENGKGVRAPPSSPVRVYWRHRFESRLQPSCVALPLPPSHPCAISA